MSKAVFFSFWKALKAEHRPSDEMLGKLRQRCALIRGRWYSQRDAAVHSWLVKQLVIPKQSFPFWITHRGVWCNFKCLKFITDDWTLGELVQNCLRIICFLLLFLYKQWVLMFLRHVGNVWMQAMMPQTQHMLTSDRGRILMLLTCSRLLHVKCPWTEKFWKRLF